MKGLILAAGLGTRLRPITSLRPKPTISVANKPLIVYAIENVAAAGVSEIGIVVNPPIYEYIKEILDECCGHLSISYIIQDPPLGLAHAVKVSRGFLQDDSFVMYLSDNLFEHGIKDYVASFQPQQGMNALLALIEVPDPRALGVAVVENGRILKLVEKPAVPPSNLAVAGVYVFDKTIHSMIETLKPGAKGEFQITDAIQALIETGGHVSYSKVQGWWKDTGKPEDILDANRLLLMKLKACVKGTVADSQLVGNVVVEADAVIANTTIFGPALIGPGARIEDAFIGPYTTLGNNVTLKNAELEYAVVGDNTHIESVKSRIQGSLIGEDVKIIGRRGRPNTHKLIIGDKSHVILQEA
jgi:glucose-1-phosphate thymidylyltransferase